MGEDLLLQLEFMQEAAKEHGTPLISFVSSRFLKDYFFISLKPCGMLGVGIRALREGKTN
jgi:hypothetical protein